MIYIYICISFCNDAKYDGRKNKRIYYIYIIRALYVLFEGVAYIYTYPSVMMYII